MTTNQRVTDFSIAAILTEEEPRVDVDRQRVDPVFPCVHCKRYLTSSFYQRRHQKYCHMKYGPRVTVEPDKVPTDMTRDCESLRQVIDGRTVYQCPYCRHQTTNRSSIRVHLMTHTGERPFKCDVCGKGFVQKGRLNVHIRTHTGEKPYKCSECDYSSSDKTTFNRHVATKHTGERTYACNICNYITAYSSNMKKHSKVHTGEKPFHCPYCQYSAKTKGILTYHIEQKHTVKNIKIINNL